MTIALGLEAISPVAELEIYNNAYRELTSRLNILENTEGIYHSAEGFKEAWETVKDFIKKCWAGVKGLFAAFFSNSKAMIEKLTKRRNEIKAKGVKACEVKLPEKAKLNNLKTVIDGTVKPFFEGIKKAVASDDLSGSKTVEKFGDDLVGVLENLDNDHVVKITTDSEADSILSLLITLNAALVVLKPLADQASDAVIAAIQGLDPEKDQTTGVSTDRSDAPQVIIRHFTKQAAQFVKTSTKFVLGFSSVALTYIKPND